jgi:hypothetical protein
MLGYKGLIDPPTGKSHAVGDMADELCYGMSLFGGSHVSLLLMGQ